MAIDRLQLIASVRTVLKALRDPELFEEDTLSAWEAKRARIDALIRERKLEELDGEPDSDGFLGMWRYHLEKPIKDGGLEIHFLTFRAPTIKQIREGSGKVDEDWCLFLVKQLSKECRSDKLIDMIGADDFDDLSEVVQFPFERRPFRAGQTKTSGKESSPSS